MRRAGWVLVAALAACGGGRDRVVVSLEGLDRPVVFAVVLRDGAPQQTAGPFAILGGATVPPTRLELSLSEERLALVALPALRDDVEIVLQSPPPSPEVDPAQSRFRTRLPAGTEVFWLDAETSQLVSDDRGDLLDSISAQIHRPELCAPDVALAPFAREATLLPGAMVYDSDLRRVRRLDDRRVLALAPGHLYLFDRDDVPGAPADDVFIGPDDAMQVEALGLDVDRRGTGAMTGLIAATARGVGGQPDRIQGRLFEFVVDVAQIRWAGTATVVEGAGFTDVAFEADGSAIVVGEGGIVLRWSPAGTITRAPDRPDSIQRIAAGAGAEPHFAAARGRLFTGDLFGAVNEHRIDAGGVSVDFAGLARSSSALWAAAHPPRLLRRRDAEFETVTPTPNPDLLPCADATGQPAQYLDLAASPTRVFAATECTAVVAITPDPPCAGPVKIQGRAIEPSTSEIRGVDVFGGWLTATGVFGAVYSARLD